MNFATLRSERRCAYTGSENRSSAHSMRISTFASRPGRIKLCSRSSECNVSANSKTFEEKILRLSSTKYSIKKTEFSGSESITRGAPTPCQAVRASISFRPVSTSEGIFMTTCRPASFLPKTHRDKAPPTNTVSKETPQPAACLLALSAAVFSQFFARVAPRLNSIADTNWGGKSEASISMARTENSFVAFSTMLR